MWCCEGVCCSPGENWFFTLYKVIPVAILDYMCACRGRGGGNYICMYVGHTSKDVRRSHK